ncbi:MAG: transglutaminase domain-containing protein [Saccharofermentans sp.]|nr:transglutaminase domain-containing protein [Saccharofermentans sp.]
MKSKKITGIVLVSAVLFSGCSKADVIEQTSAEDIVINSGTTEITETTTAATTESETEPEKLYEFNPHLYSVKIGDKIPDENYQALYNLTDAVREGKDTFECASEEAYKWATDPVTLNNLLPAACMKITGESDDGTVPFENGVGRIYYNMPAEEFVIREAEYEADIEDVLNTWLDYDDTDFEKCIKLYDYMESTFVYGEIDGSSTGDGADYKAFRIRQGVCDHLASIYAYLLMQAGVDALNIGIFEPGMCHAWTYVVINGEGYHIDPTWSLKNGTDDLYLYYFMMSDEKREDTGCLLNDITAPLLPRYWAKFYDDLDFKANDSSLEFPICSVLDFLDEENKILYYRNESGEVCEMRYG